MNTPNRKLRPPEAARFLGIAESTLAKMRLKGNGPPFSKLGVRIVAYDLNDIENWVESRKRNSTSDSGTI